MRYLVRLAVSLILLQLTIGTALAVTPEEMKKGIEARYKLTIPGFLGDYKEIGTLFVVRQEGLRADRPGPLFKPNVITDGRLVTPGGGETPLGNDMDGNLKPGDRLYLYGVNCGNDYVELALFTVRTFIVKGLRGPTPLQASVRFRYDKGLAQLTTAQFFADVAAWFSTEGEIGTGIRGEPETAGKMAKTVHFGQTPAEVTAILGPPDKEILLGNKSILVYRSLKLIFIDGKLADAE